MNRPTNFYKKRQNRSWGKGMDPPQAVVQSAPGYAKAGRCKPYDSKSAAVMLQWTMK